MPERSATGLAQAEQLLAELAAGLSAHGHARAAAMPTHEQLRSALQREQAALQGYRDHLHAELREIETRLAELATVL